MLSQLGQNFDPLGFGAPFFLKARLILQQLAVDKFDWDTDVPSNVVKEWNTWPHSLLLLEEFLMNRWYFLHCGPLKSVNIAKYQLHDFSNASNQAYSVVIYLPRLLNLYYHNHNWHSGIQHTLLSSRQKFWITNGRASVRRYLRKCSVCAINKARPIRQLMSDLPPSRISAYKKHFFTVA